MMRSQKNNIIFHRLNSETNRSLDICMFVSSEHISRDNEQNKKNINILVARDMILNNLVNNPDSTPVININMASLDNGIIVNTYKGIPDELNNGIYHTYFEHGQEYPLQVKRLVTRDIDLKIEYSVRLILSFFTKSKYSELIKQYINKTILEKIKMMWKIKYSELSPNNITGAGLFDTLSILGFQIAQTICLIRNNHEIYTKCEAIRRVPETSYLLTSAYSISLVDKFQLVMEMYLETIEAYIN